MRNVLIALGNSASPQLCPLAERHMNASQPLIRGAAVWAVRRLASNARIAELKLAFLPAEPDMEVRAEWAAEVQPAH